MAFKKLTIMILPSGTQKMRQLKIPRFLFFLLFLFSLTAGYLLYLGIQDYRVIKSKVPKLAVLQKENNEQRVQLARLTQKMDHISQKLVDLKKFEHKLKVMVNLETTDEGITFFGIGGSDPASMNPDYTIEKAHKKLVRLMHQSLDNLGTEISVQIQDKAELYRFLEDQKSMLACTPSVWPTKGWISSRFGKRISPFTNDKEFHSGLDISAKMKTPIYAPADGVITSVGRSYGYGKRVNISHGYGLKTVYAHLYKSLVKKGQSVKRGQKIALVGNSGRTTGPHLHYEVHLKGVPVNPLRYILN